MAQWWRDNRYAAEREADRRYAELRLARTVEASRRLDAVLGEGIREGRRMSLLGKMKHLTESAQDFHRETEAVLDGIAEKIAAGRRKRDEAAAKHHAYYDAIIAGVDESLGVIDRLSNGPLPDGGERSGG